MGVEQGKGACFGYGLERCAGACCGKEHPALYNARVSAALTDKRVRPWPYDGPVAVVEESDTRWEAHVVDQWAYLGSAQTPEDVADVAAGAERVFEYDTYQILKKFVGGRGTKEITNAK